MKSRSQAQTNLVIVLAVLVLLSTLQLLLAWIGFSIIPMIVLTLADVIAFVLILIYLPRLKWKR